MNNQGTHRRHSLTGGTGPYLMLGWQIALAFFVYAAIGFFLDRTLGTSPWLLLAGILMGLVAVFARIYRVTLETSGKRSPDGKRPPEGTPGETWTADP